MGKIAINIATGTLQQEELVVGIDLGTTNSLVAVIHPDTGLATVLREFDNSALVPSIVHIDQQAKVTAGEEAKKYLLSDPARTVFSVKRLTAKLPEDIAAGSLPYAISRNATSGNADVRIGEAAYSPAQISGFILSELKHRAEHILKTPVNKAVITVPAYFNDAQRQVTREAGRLAGLEVLRIINEPTAASMAYGLGLEQGEEKLIAVYDLGGGTFDISVLRVHDGIFDVLSTNGDTALGGDDFDQKIAEYWSQQQPGKADLPSLRLLAEEAKRGLTNEAVFESKFNGAHLRIERNIFDELTAPLISRTLDACKQALKDAGVTANDIEEVVLVGGSTRIPAVQEKVAAFFGKTPHTGINPDEAVALGAAIQADILAGNNKGMLLLDITPLSLGLETAGGLMEVMIPRNSKIPATASREYTTQVDGQGDMRITLYQGERDLVKDNRRLDEFRLTGIPAMPAGLAKVRVSFLINADGILTVTAKELRSGVQQVIEVKPQEGIGDHDVETMLEDSLKNAEKDIDARALAEARTEGEQLLKTTEKFLQKNSPLLAVTELTNTAMAMQSLQLAITMEDKKLIAEKIEELNEISRPYAERVMNEAVSKAMSGTKI